MNCSSLTLKEIQLKFSHSLILLFFVCCEMFLPIEGWAQSISDAGSFTFTGTHNPLQVPVFREWLGGDGLRAGPVKIHPFLGIAETFSDNVFRTKKRRRSDFLTTIAPGMQVYLPFGGTHSFLVDYRAAQLLYKKFTENNVLSQNGAGHLKFRFPNGLKVSLQGGHEEGFDSRGSTLDIQNRDITKWRSSSFLGETRWDGSRGGIQLRSQYIRLHYKNNGQDRVRDRKSARADLTGFLKATSTISALLGTNIGTHTYDQNKQVDSFYYGVFTGFALAPSRLLSGDVRVGYTILNFDRAPVPQPPGSNLSPGGDEQKSITLQGRLVWTPTTRTSLNILPFRLIQQSGVNTTSTFITTGVSISAKHQLTNRLAITGTFFYSDADFNEGRRDRNLFPSMGLEYRAVKWLGFRLGYNFAKRFSNQNNFDFYSNSIMVSVQGLL